MGCVEARWDRIARVTHAGSQLRLEPSMEHESMVDKFHGRQVLCVHHELEWFDPMTHRRSHTSIGGRGRPYSEASHDQGGGGNGKGTNLAHLGSPRLPELADCCTAAHIIAMHN